MESSFRALSDSILALASEQKIGDILAKLVDAARDLVGARYGAIGVPDEEGGFDMFITSGITDAQIEAIGPLPRSHGMLDAILHGTGSYRTRDLQSDERYEGWWPAAHPDMHSMLGVPIVSKGKVVGAFYLTDKIGADEFTEDDQKLIEQFAAHAAVAIVNAQLLARSRELTVVEERNRLARDLHDSVTQTLFSLRLTAEAAATFVGSDPARAADEVARVKQLAQEAIDEMRSLVFELRPADLVAEGLVPTLVKHVDVVRRVHGANVDLRIEGERRLSVDLELALFRIVQEALNNAIKHADAGRIEVTLEMKPDSVRATVSDTGVGFEPEGVGVRTKHLGLTTMEERAAEIDGTLRIESVPARGTQVSIEVRT